MSYSQYGTLSAAGLVNPVSGLGTLNDKSQFSYYIATILNNPVELEATYVQSWAAKRYIDIIPDRMLQKLRVFNNLTNDLSTQYQDYLNRKRVDQFLLQTLKAARLTGSAFMIMVTLEQPLTAPLNVDLLQKGDLATILVYDRFSVFSYNCDEMYRIFPRFSQGFDVHKSRVLRIDGIQPLVSDGWQAYDIYYGVSELLPVFQDITQSDQVARFTTQMMSEASIAYFKIQGMKAVNGMKSQDGGFGYDLDSTSVAETPQRVDQQKSIYNAVFLDADDDFGRVGVNLGGVASILDAYADRLAAAAGIPSTVFLGTQPKGFNATGESDLRVFSDQIASKQSKELIEAYRFIDSICSRTSGLNKIPTFEFPSLMDDSEAQKAEVLVEKTQAVTALVGIGLMTIDEGREALDGDPILGALPPLSYDFLSEFNKTPSPSDAPVATNTSENPGVTPATLPSIKTDIKYAPPKNIRNVAKQLVELPNVSCPKELKTVAKGRPIGTRSLKKIADLSLTPTCSTIALKGLKESRQCKNWAKRILQQNRLK